MTISDLLDYQGYIRAAVFIVDPAGAFKNELGLRKNPREVIWQPSDHAKDIYNKTTLRVTPTESDFRVSADDRNSYRVCLISTREGSGPRIILGAFIKIGSLNDGESWRLREIVRLDLLMENSGIDSPAGPHTAIVLNRDDLERLNRSRAA